MSLPIQISPNPLFVTTIELRFLPSLADNYLTSLYPKFAETFPKLEPANIPRALNILNDPNNLFAAPEFILSNDVYSMALGKNIIAIENKGEYTLWGNYFPFASEQIKKVFSLTNIHEITRIGVRYGSIFKDVKNILDKLKIKFLVPLDGYVSTGKLDNFRGDFKKDEYNLRLQISNQVNIIKNNRQFNGALIDIDASFNKKEIISNKVFDIIDELHTVQKTFFFEGLLTPEFISTLNPKYE